MATINGRRVKLLNEESQPIGIAREWTLGSDWMKVITDDGVTYMVHCADKIEFTRNERDSDEHLPPSEELSDA